MVDQTTVTYIFRFSYIPYPFIIQRIWKQPDIWTNSDLQIVNWKMNKTM